MQDIKEQEEEKKQTKIPVKSPHRSKYSKFGHSCAIAKSPAFVTLVPKILRSFSVGPSSLLKVTSKNRHELEFLRFLFLDLFLFFFFVLERNIPVNPECLTKKDSSVEKC